MAPPQRVFLSHTSDLRSGGGADYVAAAEAAWAKALALMARQDLALLVLDELCIALRYNYLDTDSVVAALRARRPGLHVVATGAYELVEAAAAAEDGSIDDPYDEASATEEQEDLSGEPARA